MSVKKLVSVVIPNYNSASYIVNTLDSVLHQTYDAVEIIIIDDKSNDTSLDIIQDYIKTHCDAKIKLICLEENFGMPAAPRNIGVNHSSGDWIAFLDCDDIWHPLKLELQMKILMEKKGHFCSTRMVDFRSDSEISFDEVSNPNVKNITFKQQLLKNTIPTSSVLVKKDLMLKYKFNESKEYAAREDFDCWLKIHENIDSSIKINESLLFYRLVNNQMSSSRLKMILRNWIVLKNYRFNDGKGLGVIKYFYFTTQILLAVYYRLLRKTL